MNYDDLMITNQRFFMVLPFNGRYHFNKFNELRDFCIKNDLEIEDQDIRLGYDSDFDTNTFLYFDSMNYIEPKVIAEVERNQHKKKIAKIFETLDNYYHGSVV